MTNNITDKGGKKTRSGGRNKGEKRKVKRKRTEKRDQERKMRFERKQKQGRVSVTHEKEKKESLKDKNKKTIE